MPRTEILESHYLGPTSSTTSGDPGSGAYAEFNVGQNAWLVGIYLVAYNTSTVTPVSTANRMMHVPVQINIDQGIYLVAGKAYGQYGPSNDKNGHLYVGAFMFPNIIEPIGRAIKVKARFLLPDQVGNVVISGQVVDGLTVGVGTSLKVLE